MALGYFILHTATTCNYLQSNLRDMSNFFELTFLLKVEFFYVKYSVPTMRRMRFELEKTQCLIKGIEPNLCKTMKT